MKQPPIQESSSSPLSKQSGGKHSHAKFGVTTRFWLCLGCLFTFPASERDIGHMALTIPSLPSVAGSESDLDRLPPVFPFFTLKKLEDKPQDPIIAALSRFEPLPEPRIVFAKEYEEPAVDFIHLDYEVSPEYDIWTQKVAVKRRQVSPCDFNSIHFCSLQDSTA